MTHTMEIDGVEIAFSEGETILEIALRHQKEIQRSATTQGLNLSVDVVFASSS